MTLFLPTRSLYRLQALAVAAYACAALVAASAAQSPPAPAAGIPMDGHERAVREAMDRFRMKPRDERALRVSAKSGTLELRCVYQHRAQLHSRASPSLGNKPEALLPVVGDLI